MMMRRMLLAGALVVATVTVASSDDFAALPGDFAPLPEEDFAAQAEDTLVVMAMAGEQPTVEADSPWWAVALAEPSGGDFRVRLIEEQDVFPSALPGELVSYAEIVIGFDDQIQAP